MFINISSDKVHIIKQKKEIFFDRNGIENVLGQELVKSYKKTPFKKLLVLNGPGGFTNIRVGTLCINLLNTLEKNKIKIYDIDKIALYQHFYDKGHLPQYGVIYIGQKKNIWIYDFQNKVYKNGTIEGQTDLNDYFLDEVQDDTYYETLDTKRMLKISYLDDQIQITFKQKKTGISIQELNIKPAKQIHANYMIAPQIN